MHRRGFIRLTAGSAIAASSEHPEFATLRTKPEFAQSSATDHLAHLTAWYKAMDSTDGKAVELFSDDVSYLRAN